MSFYWLPAECSTEPHVHRNVKPQARIEHFEQLCEVQSDKASVEITSPYDGVISQIHVQEGQIAKVGQGLCTIEVEEEDDGSQTHEESQNPKVEETLAASHLITKPVEASGGGESVYSTPVPSPSTSTQDQKSVRRRHPLDPEASTEPPQAVSRDEAEAERKTLATPSVRHFAREKGVPRLSQLWPGSGKGGRIEKSDVESWVAGSSNNAKSAAPASTAKESVLAPVSDTTVEFGRTRWAMWRAMEQVRYQLLTYFGG